MDNFVIAVFFLTYLGMAFGSVPGLRLDRTGIALLAVVVLLVSGKVGVKAMGSSIDVPTLLLLFALMIVSAQFQLAGVYGAVAQRVAESPGSARRLLGLVVAVSGGLSAVLANDVVCFAMTPIIAEGIRRRGLDPRPYLLGLVGAANAGSAATLIGNPQNILIGQVGGLDFWNFLAACAVPAALSLVAVYACVAWIWQRELDAVPEPVAAHPPAEGHRWQAVKGGIALAVLALLFAAPLPREVGAMVIAALLLASRRMCSREMIGLVDWHLLLLFACLFVVTGAFADTDLARHWVNWLAENGLFPDSLKAMVPVALVASNSIGNVPAVMLILAVWPTPDTGALTGLALLSTLAGNFLLVGSMANIIVAERAAGAGCRLSFGDFARAGIPMTLVTMAIAIVWLRLGGWMTW
ncbi:Arsenic efflux pump protein [Paramagnetospirillum magnetotacticum MS-1]|uniref:Arsenic efflux pump protein n=1 Tax=Paramagnetospirillum magnetotacticum MS-1 TaxID=272627 RepID=A0A0C2V241_PARME|nr:anion transporter [Paramagnetospirillum magnetotacticum]KIL99126.1 Arsenic efflux pump protein [Paramagnetospirillum magnetotacticum MS-1]